MNCGTDADARKILIVEDDASIAEIERDYLASSGFTADIAPDGPTGLAKGLAGGYCLILLDVMLPGMDGFIVCRRLREKTDVPILMVTARREDVDKIRGLGKGADDYIEKPFSPGVLVARIKAHLAQYERLKGAAPERKEIKIRGLAVNTETHRVFLDGKEVDLKNKEYELLLFLMTNTDILFNREQLYDRIWGSDGSGDAATVPVHVNRLREKLEKDPAHPEYIETVWGAGYRFRA